ncbi:MAG: hypothetical protein Q8R02_15155 [Hyphomonadaceae bacterium]|nr:hypothetical protein [Hyphomonadaceae bacterium]
MQTNGAMLSGMLGAAFLHACRETWKKRAGSFFVALVGIGVVLAFRWPQPGDTVTEHVTTALLGLAGSFGALFAIFLWNLALAPYRIERDRRKDLESEVSKLAVKPAASAAPYPTMRVRDLFFHIRPDLLESKGGKIGLWEVGVWQQVEQMFRDEASLGRLSVWGRPFDDQGVSRMLAEVSPLEPIPAEYWRRANLTHNFYDEKIDFDRCDTYPDAGSGLRPFCDLQVDEAQALALWPEPSPDSKIHVDVELSGYGIEKVYTETLTGVPRVRWGEESKATMEIYFYRPINRNYTVTASGDQQVFSKIIRKDPASVLLEIRGPSNEKFPARITVTVLGSGITPKRD